MKKITKFCDNGTLHFFLHEHGDNHYQQLKQTCDLHTNVALLYMLYHLGHGITMFSGYLL